MSVWTATPIAEAAAVGVHELLGEHQRACSSRRPGRRTPRACRGPRKPSSPIRSNTQSGNVVSSHSSAWGWSSLITKRRIDSRSCSCSSVKMKCLRWAAKSGLRTSAVAMSLESSREVNSRTSYLPTSVRVAVRAMPYATLRYEVSRRRRRHDRARPAGDAQRAVRRAARRADRRAARRRATTTRVRCVVLTSTHDRVFSGGANLGGFAADVPLVHKHFGDRAVPASCSALLGELGKPSICAANGHVLAGALGHRAGLRPDHRLARARGSGRPRSTSACSRS